MCHKNESDLPKVPVKLMIESIRGATGALHHVGTISAVDGDLSDVGALLDVSHDFYEAMVGLFVRLMKNILRGA